MKKLLLAPVPAMTVLGCNKSNDNNSQVHISASQVPAAVMTTYNAKYPSASGQIEWEIEHGNTYKVKFIIGSQHLQAPFNTDGTFIDEQKTA
jgi:hypothetical protein